jgi:predicted transcriptional regulator
VTTPKKEVLDLVQGLPEEASLEDIQYHLYVLQKVRKGLKDVEEGRTLSQEEMRKRFEKWIVS